MEAKQNSFRFEVIFCASLHVLTPTSSYCQISGSFSSVKKALLSVSSCLQDYQRTEPTNSARTVPLVPMDPYAHWNYMPSPHVSEYHFRGYAPNPGAEISPSSQRKVEVVFRMLCSNDKVWSIIGKGGIVIRTMQNETGASIKIADPVSDSDERVITISAHEVCERKSSNYRYNTLLI